VTFALTDVFAWDGISNQRSEQTLTVRIEGDRITGFGPESELAGGIETLSLRGCTVLPGLIDAHVHLCLDPTVFDPHEQVRAPRAERVRGMEARARSMLRAGITTARDLGGGEGLELALRDRIASGSVSGPRLLCAGQPVTSPRGHCHFWGGEAGSDAEIQAVIRRQVERRADWIKVMATGGVMSRGTKPSASQFDSRQLSLVVSEAALHGRSVAAHCHGTEGIRRAAAARVRTIEHCSFVGEGGFGTGLDPEVAREVAASGAWVSPTVNLGWGRRLREAEEDRSANERSAAFVDRMSAVFEELSGAGARFIASTDAGIPGVVHDALVPGLRAFARYASLGPCDVLRAATSVAAEAIGLGDEVGTLAVGRVADLLVVKGNPLRDLAALSEPRLVVARGQRVVPPAPEAQGETESERRRR